MTGVTGARQADSRRDPRDRAAGNGGVRLVPAAADHVLHGPDRSGPGGRSAAGDRARSPGGPAPERSLRSWPLLVLALPAAVAVWSGWVGIGRLTGFGEVHPLPGIWDSLHLDTAVTLPIGIEAYAAYALRAWLSASTTVSARTRRFARWSATGSLALGMAGQVAYHLLTQAHSAHAPWGITTAVSCLPVLVLGMGAALAHMIRADASGESEPYQASPAGPWPAGDQRDRDIPNGHRAAGEIRQDQLAEARTIAAQLTAAGQRVSRRSLRAAGLHGSNADLGVLALASRSDVASTQDAAAMSASPCPRKGVTPPAPSGPMPQIPRAGPVGQEPRPPLPG